MRISLFTFAIMTLAACKTPSREGSSLSSLSIGNAKACKRTQERISEAYEKKELRSLAEKGHRYLIQEIAKGNKAAMITEAALRIATFQKSGAAYADIIQRVFDGTASEGEVAKFTAEYQKAGGLKAAVEVLRTAQRAVIAQYVADIQASHNSTNEVATKTRAEAKEIVREITDWANEMSSRLASGEQQSAKGQPSLRQESEAVRAVVDTVLVEFLKGNQKLYSQKIEGLAEAEVAQLELAKANTDLAEGRQGQNVERLVTEVFKKYGSTKSPEIQRALSIQTLHMLGTAEVSPELRRNAEMQLRSLFGRNEARLRVAEMASLEGLLEVAEQSGQTKRASELQRQLENNYNRLKQEMKINDSTNLKDANQRRSAIERLVREAQNRNKFEATSDYSYYRSFYRRIAESARRGRQRK